ncbi:MAG TPA: hypothetical protein VKX46_00835, partial [Ktedonobacteraceae bacterium]|nr:hypothetical protein [Ktedonobacteraceae bacterium]
MSTHSCVIAPHLKEALSKQASDQANDSKYSRMFPNLPALDTDEAVLLAMSRAGSVMDASASEHIETQDEVSNPDNPRIPAGFAFLGQFIAHDITADRSLLIHHARLEELRN